MFLKNMKMLTAGFQNLPVTKSKLLAQNKLKHHIICGAFFISAHNYGFQHYPSQLSSAGAMGQP